MYEVGMSCSEQRDNAHDNDVSLRHSNNIKSELDEMYAAKEAVYEFQRNGKYAGWLPFGLKIGSTMAAIALTVSLAGFGSEGNHLNNVAELELQRDWDEARITKKVNDAFLIPVKREFASTPNIDPIRTASVVSLQKSSAPKSISEITAAAGIGFYVVKPGDTLSAIAAKHGIKASALIARNKIDDPRKIRPGMQLVLALSTPASNSN